MVDVRDGTPASVRLFAETDTIPELVRRIRTMIAEQPDELDILYDSSSGLPVHVAVDDDREAVDDEMTIWVYDLTATTPVQQRFRRRDGHSIARMFCLAIVQMVD